MNAAGSEDSRVGNSYHEIHLSEDPQRKVVWREIANHLSRFITGSAAVLELGAGYCDWINQVQAKERVATDLWDGITRYAGVGVRCVVGDVVQVLRSLSPQQFDAILASNFFEHFNHAELDSLLEHVRERLQREGVLIVIQPNFTYAYRQYFDDYTHRAVFTAVSLPAFLRSKGFEIVRVVPRFLPLTMKSRLPKWRWLVRAYLWSPFRPLAGQMLIVARKAEGTNG